MVAHSTGGGVTKWIRPPWSGGQEETQDPGPERLGPQGTEEEPPPSVGTAVEGESGGGGVKPSLPKDTTGWPERMMKRICDKYTAARQRRSPDHDAV